MTSRGRLLAALTLAAQPLALNIVSVFATAYIIRRLGPLQYGMWAVATSVMAANAFLANLGLRPLFVRSLAQTPEDAPRLLAEQLTLRLLMASGAGAAALLLCAALRYPPVVLTCVVVSAVGFGIVVAYTVMSDLLQAYQRFHTTAAIGMIAGLALTALSIVAVWAGAGPVWLSVAYLTGPLVSLTLMVRAVRREGVTIRLTWHGGRFRQLLRNSRSVAAQMVVATLRDKVEELLVPRLVGIQPFGFFAAGIMPASRLTFVSDGIATAFYPAISNAFVLEQGKRDATEHVALMTTVALIVTLPLAIAISFAAGIITPILFPAGGDICRRVMMLTVWSAPLLALAQTMTSSMQAAGRHAQAARAWIWASVASVTVSAFLVWSNGIEGATWAWLVRQAILAAALTPGFLRCYPRVRRLVPVWRILCSALAAVTLLWRAAPLQDPVSAAAWIGVAIVLYGATLVLLGVVRPSTIISTLAVHAQPAVV
jgi:O-antigen/teichoic acid export membrane protein